MNLSAAIHRKTARIGVIGLGYVGLPLLRAFWDAGFAVIGFDIDEQKIKTLRRGGNFLRHLGANLVRPMARSKRFSVTSDFRQLPDADALLICVPTPLGQRWQPDLSYIERTADQIALTLRQGQLIVLESSTYPGTTREILLPRFTAHGLRCGRDFYLAYSPERQDPGSKNFSTATIPKLVGGIDKASGRLATALYRQAIDKVIPVSTAEVAEAAKLLENIYRAVNIALVNEMKIALTAMDIDIWEVIAAAATKPFGFQPFYPGPGLGGHCIPIDPFYLAWKARQVGVPTRFIELAGQVNHHMPDYVVKRTVTALKKRKRAIKGARILILGLAYKPNVDDVRESPSFELIEKFRALGARVDYNDPWVASTHKMRRHDLRMKSVKLSAKKLASYDCVVIATHHDAYDWQSIADHAQLIVDTRHALGRVRRSRAVIVKA